MFTLENVLLYGVSILVVMIYIIYKNSQHKECYTDFYPDMDKLYDMPKLWAFAEQSYYESIDNLVDGRVEVIIDTQCGLSKYELNIVEGIVLINGHLYYEV